MKPSAIPASVPAAMGVRALAALSVRAACAVSAALVLSAGGFAADDAKAKPAADAAAVGWLLGTDGKLRIGAVKAGDGGVTVDGAAVASESVLACDCGEQTPAIIDQGLVLTDGTLMRGMVKSLQAGKLAFTGDLTGAREYPAAGVSAVVVTPAPVGVLAGLPADFTGAILINGDRVAGDPAFINAKTVGIDNHRRVVQLTRNRVLAVVLHPAVHGEQVRHWARLANGDRMDAGAVNAKGVALSGAGGGPGLTVPGAMLRALLCDGGKYQALSGLTAKTSSGQQNFGEKAVPAPVAGLAPGWPRAAGLRFEHAIMGPAGGEIAYDIGGKFATLFAVIAPADDCVGAPVCRVLVDGHQVFDSGALSAPQGIAVPLSGGKELRLVVVNAANVLEGGAAATALWGEPVLAQ